MNIPDEAADPRLTAERKNLYEAGMLLLGPDPDAAEKNFQAIVSGGHGAQGKFSSLAHLRLALIRLQANDLDGMVQSLQSSLDGAGLHPDRDWVGQLLQSIAQGAQVLVRSGEGKRVLGLLGRLIDVASKAAPGGLALEVELGAGALKAQVELAAGMTQAGIDSLAKVVRHPVAGLNPAERAHSAAAADMMAQAYEALGRAGPSRGALDDCGVPSEAKFIRIG